MKSKALAADVLAFHTSCPMIRASAKVKAEANRGPIRSARAALKPSREARPGALALAFRSFGFCLGSHSARTKGSSFGFSPSSLESLPSYQSLGPVVEAEEVHDHAHPSGVKRPSEQGAEQSLAPASQQQ